MRYTNSVTPYVLIFKVSTETAMKSSVLWYIIVPLCSPEEVNRRFGEISYQLRPKLSAVNSMSHKPRAIPVTGRGGI
jgi:hypothetical protein